MSPAEMLSTSYPTSHQQHLPKLAADGSNWIIYKGRVKIYATMKKLGHLLEGTAAPPTKPEPPNNSATATEVTVYESALEKFEEFIWQNAEIQHVLMSTIPETLMIKTINLPTASDQWKVICAEHESKTKRFAVEMIRNLQNQRCQETDDIRHHFAKMIRLREELATTGKIIDDLDFTSILTNSLPPSYDAVISSAYAAAIAIDKEIGISQLIAVVQEEYSRRQISSGSTHPTSTALFTNPQKPSSKRNDRRKKGKDICTNQKCRFRHSHEFKDCRSEGGPLHGQSPPHVRNQSNGNRNKKSQEGRNAQQIMRANVAHEDEATLEHAFSVTASFSIADIPTTANPTNPSERIEIYDSGASCHMSPYIEAFTDFMFIEPKPISATDNRTFEAVGKGSIKVGIPNDEGHTTVTLRDVLYAPAIGFTLISLS